MITITPETIYANGSQWPDNPVLQQTPTHQPTTPPPDKHQPIKQGQPKPSWPAHQTTLQSYKDNPHWGDWPPEPSTQTSLLSPKMQTQSPPIITSYSGEQQPRLFPKFMPMLHTFRNQMSIGTWCWQHKFNAYSNKNLGKQRLQPLAVYKLCFWTINLEAPQLFH